jgi:hypothetical protein
MSVGAAGDRVAELLDRWLAGVEMHARYLELDDAAYARVQDWPRHQRPTGWIVDLARSRCVELKRQLTERRARGDDSFADALELMAFLTNLLGSEHVERFIPLPDLSGTKRPRQAGTVTAAAPAAAAPAAAAPAVAAPAVARPAVATPAAATGGAEVPPGKAPAERPPAAPRAATRSKSGAGTRGNTRTPAAARAARAIPSTSASQKAVPAPSAPDPSGTPDARSSTVIADAVRLLNWGRPWPQLASLIARLADRPAEAEVWEILRRHRTSIESQARPPTD